jgi:monovalent cation:H+ antiporter-2, CPA2 family
MEPATTHYQDLLIVLGVAGLIVPLLHRIGINSILGFLAVGLVLSPGLLGAAASYAPFLNNFLLTNPEELSSLAEFGVVF